MKQEGSQEKIPVESVPVPAQKPPYFDRVPEAARDVPKGSVIAEEKLRFSRTGVVDTTEGLFSAIVRAARGAYERSLPNVTQDRVKEIIRKHRLKIKLEGDEETVKIYPYIKDVDTERGVVKVLLSPRIVGSNEERNKLLELLSPTMADRVGLGAWQVDLTLEGDDRPIEIPPADRKEKERGARHHEFETVRERNEYFKRPFKLT